MPFWSCRYAINVAIIYVASAVHFNHTKTVSVSLANNNYNLFMFALGSHLGRDKTLEKITSRFFWRNMNDEIRQFVQKCDKCQRMNPKFVKSNAKLHPIPVQAKVWHQVSCFTAVSTHAI